MREALIVLADGQIFNGEALGASGVVTGEAVFTTGMNGYIETLTDPSYYGQIVIQTFPLIGNYGIIEDDFESESPHLMGYVVRYPCNTPSNFRSEGTLDAFLKAHNIIGIAGVDTRALTRTLREAGVMNAMIVAGDTDEGRKVRQELTSEDGLARLLRRIASYKVTDAVAHVSHGGRQETHGNGRVAVLWDFGAKENIRRCLEEKGLDVVRVGADASANEILGMNASLLMLSNGPGDPADNAHIIEELRKVLAKGLPTFGICLGHQLMALAMGARTEKLKYGHRGANQSVKCIDTGRVYITSQNHGYAVVPDSLPRGARMNYINANDGTCEGVIYDGVDGVNAFSVQFHPEAASGPHDTRFLFDEAVRMINKAAL